MFNAFIAWLAKILLPVLWDFLKEKVEKTVDDKLKEDRAKKADDKEAKEAVADVRKPLDPKKSVEERQKDAEDAFDKFRDRLN